MALGFGVTWYAETPTRMLALTSQEPQPEAACAVKHASGSETEHSDAVLQYVQEPLTRSAFRPDFRFKLSQAYQRSNLTMLRAFSEAVVDARLSTVRLVDSAGELLAMGAVVDAEGWIATKASQLPPNTPIVARLFDNSEVAAEVVQQVADVDVALLRVRRSGLVPITWAGASIPARGTWLATTDIEKMPSAVGVVSAGTQNIAKQSPVLGVELQDSPAGAAIRRVLYGTGADIAGLQVGDIIVSVNGQAVKSHKDFQRAIGVVRGGQVIELIINRGEREFEVSAQLMDLSRELMDETEMEVNGPVSARSTGFNRVLLHDTVLSPSQCGGPLCNLDGQCVGLNIARAGRVCSYALPVDVIRPMLENMIAQAKLVSLSTAAEPNATVR